MEFYFDRCVIINKTVRIKHKCKKDTTRFSWLFSLFLYLITLNRRQEINIRTVRFAPRRRRRRRCLCVGWCGDVLWRDGRGCGRSGSGFWRCAGWPIPLGLKTKRLSVSNMPSVWSRVFCYEFRLCGSFEGVLCQYLKMFYSCRCSSFGS